MKKLLCLLALAGLLLSLTACSFEIPTIGAEEETTKDQSKKHTTEAVADAGEKSTEVQEKPEESTKSGALFPTRTPVPEESAAETLPSVTETTAVPETLPVVPTTAVSETPEIPETTEVPETPTVIETTAVPETTEVPKTTQMPETTEVPETAQVPETTEIPETTEVPGTTQVPETTEVPETTQAPETTEVPETTPAETEPVVVLVPGDILSYGRYEQDGISSNGKEEIQWIVLYAEDGKALLLSRYCLDCRKAHEKDANITWEGSDLRKWLNSSFLNEAFSASERAGIVTVQLENKANPKSGYGAAGDTVDTVFLLSVEEVEKYLSGNMYQYRGTTPTRYAMDHGSALADNGNTWWWLRTSGKDLHYFAEIYSYREFDYMGDYATNPEQAVRPAIVIDISVLAN